MKFLSENSDVLKWWDEVENAKRGLFANRLLHGSNKVACWKCQHGHQWTDVIYKFVKRQRCPICSNKRVLRGVNDLPTLFPHLAREWDEEVNAGLDICAFIIGSAKRVGWKCSQCGTQWKTSIRHRTQQQTGCPHCAREKRPKKRTATLLQRSKSLAEYPVVEQWDYEKNGNLNPQEFLPGSNREVWWKCPVCSYEWKAKIANRTILKRACPCCANKVVVQGINDLETSFPQLAREWHPTKNGKLLPSMVTYGGTSILFLFEKDFS